MFTSKKQLFRTSVRPSQQLGFESPASREMPTGNDPGLWQGMLARLWREDEGILTFEYILLLTMVVLGTVGTMGSLRDAINHELTGLTQSIRALDEMRPATATTNANGPNGSPHGAAPANTSGHPVQLADPGFTAANVPSATVPGAVQL